MATVNLNGANIQNLDVGGGYSVGVGSGTEYGSILSPDFFGLLMPGNPGDRYFTLSAHTALVVEGNAQSAAAVDLTKLGSEKVLSEIKAGQFELAVRSAGYALGGLFAADGTQVDGFQINPTASQYLGVTGTYQNGYPASASDQAAFHMQMNNDAGSAVDGGLMLGVGIQLLASEEAVGLTPQPPDVPEPGTVGLMGLGLGMMAWRLRQHRKA